MPLSATLLSWLTLVALGLAAVGVVIALAAWRRAGVRRFGGRRPIKRRMLPRPRTKTLPLTSEEVSAEIHRLRRDVASTLRHMAVVRYDAFGDMGGHLSWSMALLDDGGDGVVLTSIHGRSDSRTYAKNVSAWSANQQLSPEEEEAIGFARAEA
ncbi:MAG TPA: DUF4446 family protein [Nocardioidaceae bacterium]|jgi:hypothetical protein